MYRRNAVTFSVPNGIDNLSQELRDLLNEHHKEEARPCPQMSNYDNVIWIEQECLDHLCINELFWESLVNDELVSVANFRVKVTCYVTSGMKNYERSNDNKLTAVTCNTTSPINGFCDYLSNARYQSDFVLTAKMIEAIPDIKEWINQRGLADKFDLRRSPDTLKEGIKEYYNLTNEVEFV